MISNQKIKQKEKWIRNWSEANWKPNEIKTKQTEQTLSSFDYDDDDEEE